MCKCNAMFCNVLQCYDYAGKIATTIGNHRKVFEMQKQWSIEVVTRINEWEWLFANEPMNQSIIIPLFYDDTTINPMIMV